MYFLNRMLRPLPRRIDDCIGLVSELRGEPESTRIGCGCTD
jgi:hypothetical protein